MSPVASMVLLGGSSNSLPFVIEKTCLARRLVNARFITDTSANPPGQREIGEHPGVGFPVGVRTNHVVKAHGCVEHLVQLYVSTIGLHKAGSRHAESLHVGFGLPNELAYVVDTGNVRRTSRVQWRASSAAAEIKHGVAWFDAAVLDDFPALLDGMARPEVIVVQRHPCVRLLGDLIRRLQHGGDLRRIQLDLILIGERKGEPLPSFREGSEQPRLLIGCHSGDHRAQVGVVKIEVCLDAGTSRVNVRSRLFVDVAYMLTSELLQLSIVPLDACRQTTPSGSFFECPYRIRTRRDEPPREVVGHSPDREQQRLAHVLLPVCFVDD